jgi:phosphatidate cytidylyltransferase
MTNMIRIIYFLILAYFLLGALGFFFINRRKDVGIARESWKKFIVYALIIHVLFFSIVINPLVFQLLAAVIIVVGIFELFKLHSASGYLRKRFFLLSLLLFVVFSYGFYVFSGYEKEKILFSFLVLSIFDSFSQITGQLWGRRKIFPKISPNKTVEGFVGGALVATGSALLFDELIAIPPLKVLLLAAGIVLFAFLGDMLTSWYKRTYHVKDFSHFIPGHGGFLDRFDSLIAGGAGVMFLELWL